MEATIKDYEAGSDIGDPTDPNDKVPKTLMDALAKAITHAEETVQSGEYSVDSKEFMNRRGEFLDLLDRPEVAEFMDFMRKQSRAPFKRFPVKP